MCFCNWQSRGRDRARACLGNAQAKGSSICRWASDSRMHWVFTCRRRRLLAWRCPHAQCMFNGSVTVWCHEWVICGTSPSSVARPRSGVSVVAVAAPGPQLSRLRRRGMDMSSGGGGEDGAGERTGLRYHPARGVAVAVREGDSSAIISGPGSRLRDGSPATSGLAWATF